jgi:hypothetical protein
MIRLTRITVTAAALSLAVALAGCETFDPTSIFESDFFSSKKKLQGERQPVFPEGTPGVAQGVPPELVKGYQPPAEPEPPPVKQAQPEPKPKPKPKPKVVAKPKDEQAPAGVTVRPSMSPTAQSQPQSQTQWPDPPRQ